MNGFVLLLIIFHVVLGSRAIGQLSSVLNCPWTLGCSNVSEKRCLLHVVEFDQLFFSVLFVIKQMVLIAAIISAL
jgi:hypothetical protein